MIPADLTVMLTKQGPIALSDYMRQSLREWFDRASVEERALWVALLDESIDARSKPTATVGGKPRDISHTLLLTRELALDNNIGRQASQMIRMAATAQHPLREEALLALALGLRGNLDDPTIPPGAALCYDTIAREVAPRGVRAPRAPEAPAVASDDSIFRILVPVIAALAAFALVGIAAAVAIAWRGGP